MHNLSRLALSLALPAMFAAANIPAFAADQPATPAKKKAGPRWQKMDYGPFLQYSYVTSPNAKFDNGPGSFTGDSTARGIAIKLTEDWDAGIIFDADLLRVSAAWIGAPIKWRGLIFDGEHGWNPTLPGTPLFQTPHLPGWADASGSFNDPRPDDIKPLPPAGPLPKESAHYKGLYRHGADVVLSYSVGTAQVLQSPSLESSNDVKAIALTYNISASAKPLALMLADGNPEIPVPEPKKKPKGQEPDPPATKPSKMEGKITGRTATLGTEHFALVGAPEGAKLEINADDQLVLHLPEIKSPTNFKLLIANGNDIDDSFAAIAKASAKPADLTALTKGGPTLWKETVETKGVIAPAPEKNKEPYVVDNVTVPFENPYDAWMRIGGFDFFTSDPTKAAVSTWSGDVWIVSGIDEKLDHVTWKRFATGLFQPLGLKIVDDTIYVVGHDQITRLNDLDKDGEADFYENFNNDWQLTTAFHAFAFDLQTDPQGNFYFAFGSPVHAGGGGFQKITADHGSIMKVSKDGSKMEHYANGLRAPNGMCVGPDGQVTCGDNEGSFVPTSPLHWVKPNMFLGVSDSAHGSTVAQPKPLCWVPHNSVRGSHETMDNSCGGQAFVTSDAWGPFKGDLLHLSYGTSSIFKVLKEEVNGQVQGGVVKMPIHFSSSAMRARFNPKDGQLYVTGLKGWQTNAGKDAGFDRIRFTGGEVHLPKELHVTQSTIRITFTSALDTSLANDAANFAAEMWNYKWTPNYGSPEISVEDPKKVGHDTLTIKSAKTTADGKTVILEVEGLKPCMQMKIDYNIKAADGAPVQSSIFNTIYEFGKD